MQSRNENGNGYLRKFSVTLAIIVTISGIGWTAKGYVDSAVDKHIDRGHSGYVQRDEFSELNRKLDDIRDRLARIEGQLENK